MTKERWEELIRGAVLRADAGDDETMGLLVRSLVDAEEAKQKLREMGFGGEGVSLLGAVEAVETRMDDMWEEMAGWDA